MINLQPISGLPFSLNENGGLTFGDGVVVEETKVRKVAELELVADDPAICQHGEQIAYYMYNGVYLKSDAAALGGVSMRYELTLLMDGLMGKECVKTMGHRHYPEPKSGLEYAEICEVLYGTAHFFFQAPETDGVTTKTFVIEAKAGDKVLFPPVYDHCTINPGPGPMLFSDVIALGVSGNYAPFKMHRGGAYLEKCQGGKPAFEVNPRFKQVPPLKWIVPREYPHLSLTRQEPLYTAFLRTHGIGWEFLHDPTLFNTVFPDLKIDFQL